VGRIANAPHLNKFMSFQRTLESRRKLWSMEAKVKDLTVKELQSLISDTIKSTLEDLIEDMQVRIAKKLKRVC